MKECTKKVKKITKHKIQIMKVEWQKEEKFQAFQNKYSSAEKYCEKCSSESMPLKFYYEKGSCITAIHIPKTKSTRKKILCFCHISTSVGELTM